MLGRSYWDQWVARRAALRLLAPLVASTERRCGPIPEFAWRQPYIVGFITMLISLTAVERTRGRVIGEALGLTQLAVWLEITGLSDHMIGEDILVLSAGRDPAFEEGCRNARDFLAFMRGEATGDDLAGAIDWKTAADTCPGDRNGKWPARLLWMALFERRLDDSPTVRTDVR